MAEQSSKRNRKIADTVESINKPLAGIALSDRLSRNIEIMKELFRDDDTLIVRVLEGPGCAPLFALVYCDGLVNSALMNDSIVRPLLVQRAQGLPDIDSILYRVLQVNDAKKTGKVPDLVQAVTFGDTVLFVEGAEEALVLNSKGFQTRSIAEPEAERILSGPREGFTESIMTNLSMLHRKLRTNALKIRFRTIGRQTSTQISVCYLDGIANPGLVSQVLSRLENIEIDSVLDSNYIAELTGDSSRSPFRTSGATERPDVVAGKLLEGRIAILVDGSPVALTLPHLFIENFQSSEDYYLNYYYTSFSRALRILGFFLTVTIPGFYIALTCYRHEIIPEELFISIASERQSVPLPAPLEIFIMMIIFDILRETGVRMPSNVGQALSIVGALVIGQTAVDAKFVASSMLIIVAITGVTSLLVPAMRGPVIVCRAFVMLCASVLGLLGCVLGLCSVLIHILSLRSLGIPQVKPDRWFSGQGAKDQYIRAPWWRMRTRSRLLSPENRRRVQTEEAQ